MFDPDLALASLPAFGQGLLVSFSVILPVAVVGFFASYGLALMLMSRRSLVALPTRACVEALRGTPLLVQLYLVYYGFSQFEWLRETPLWTILREAYWCALIAFTLNHVAYTAEVFRGGLAAVPKGLTEAAKALGLGHYAIFRTITLPLSLRSAWGGYSNELVALLKGTSLLSTIAVLDTFGVAGQILQRTYDPFTPLLSCAAIYYGLYLVLDLGARQVERRLSRGFLASR